MRKQIAADARLSAANNAAQILSEQRIFKDSQQIAIYLATLAEFDSTPIIELIWQHKKHCFLPKIQEETRSLFFAQYQQGDVLQKNKVNILEPLHGTPLISPENLDIVIMPLLAFDHEGNRLGMGAGYYDRTFASYKQFAKKPLFIGLAYQEQQVPHIPRDEWDVPLDGVITQEEFILFSQ